MGKGLGEVIKEERRDFIQYIVYICEIFPRIDKVKLKQTEKPCLINSEGQECVLVGKIGGAQGLPGDKSRWKDSSSLWSSNKVFLTRIS